MKKCFLLSVFYRVGLYFPLVMSVIALCVGFSEALNLWYRGARLRNVLYQLGFIMVGCLFIEFSVLFFEIVKGFITLLFFLTIFLSWLNFKVPNIRQLVAFVGTDWVLSLRLIFICYFMAADSILTSVFCVFFEIIKVVLFLLIWELWFHLGCDNVVIVVSRWALFNRECILFAEINLIVDILLWSLNILQSFLDLLNLIHSLDILIGWLFFIDVSFSFILLSLLLFIILLINFIIGDVYFYFPILLLLDIKEHITFLELEAIFKHN